MKIIEAESKKYGLKNILVDDCDYDSMKLLTWTIFQRNTNETFYARNSGPRDPITYTQKQRFMHRVLLDITDPKIVVDHIDHNGLNNQRHNLRVATTSQNGANRRKNSGKNSSKYLGVCWSKKAKKWHAFMQTKKRSKNIGYFKSQIMAAKARDAYAKSVYGEFANLNFPTA